ncbi:unnamed protein product [Adineta steineri]|uniref:NHL repeat containing protein-like protein n=1 Tax=Adineta steineri TaxID=433720 RepID=A0A814V457_9BILA|nr:unnamed protein product [Adineta steineri]CAF1415538.1 unnamed protein product [Adineta steineri]
MLKKITFLFYIQVLVLYSFLSVEAINLSPCAKWNTTGITIFGSNSKGNGSNELSLPQGMFLHEKTNMLYVVDTDNRRIQMFSLNQTSTTGITVASNINSMYAVYVDDDEMTMYIALRFENRVEKWIKGALEGEQIGNQCKQCRNVWLDKDKNVYMTESGTHSILKWSPKTNTSITISGRIDEQGHTTDRLYFPTHVYFNQANDVWYIADTLNHRIQKWNNNSKEGITVAGSKDGVGGDNAASLANPLYVWVDEQSSVIYIVDSDNDRVQRWLPNELFGSTIVGGTGAGSKSNQLKQPTSLVFDKLGNLYVCDSKNHRIQMYALIDNQPCSKNHSYSLFTKTNNINIVILLSWIISIGSRLI